MVQRVAFGAIGGGNFGLKVSTPGNDVLTGTMEDEKLSFDSSWTKALRVRAILQGTITPANSSNILTYHTINYGFTLSALPLVITYVRLNSGNKWSYEALGPYQTSTTFYGEIYTNRMEIVSNNASGAFQYKVLVFST